MSDRDRMAWRRKPDEEPEEHEIDQNVKPQVDEEVNTILQRRTPHVSAPAPEEPSTPQVEDQDEDEDYSPQAIYRGPRIANREFDPIFALMVVGAVGIGSLPVDANVRYVILWMLLGGVGLVGYMLGNSARLSDTSTEDLQSGIGFGLAIGFPMAIALGRALETVSERMFDVDKVPAQIMDTWVLMAVVFVIPAVESLFFRGVLQQVHNPVFTAVLATLWSMLVFYPHMSLGNASGVAISIAVFFALLNFLYGYIRYRNGLAAAWSCQIVAGGLIWFLPRLLF